MAKAKSAKGHNPKSHPDHSAQLSKLNRVEGQVAGVKKMIDERRYCTDIILQVRATRKALASIEASLLETHLRNCVSGAIESGGKLDKDKKISEIIQIFKSANSQGIEF